MTAKLFRISATAIALALATPLAYAADVYKVSAQIFHGRDAVANPVLLVNESSHASIAISGEDGYEFVVGLEHAGGADQIEVAVQVKTSLGSVSSMVTTNVGQPTSITAGDIGLTVTVARDDS